MGSIIDSMCMTWRHDYGLYKPDDDDSFSSGMTTAERESLRRKMAQLHAHHIAPLEARIAELERASQPGSGEAVKLLADKHTGMRVDYQGLFKQARGALRREPVIAEMLRQFQDHMTELGQRWYAGDTAVVDELLQLYCVERDARASLDGRREEGQ